jgi:pimeloyl-ACP methyl ester carboxylesterase
MAALTRRMLMGGVLGSPVARTAEAVPARRTVRAGSLRFPVLLWGKEPAPPVMLLHGFPQEPQTWTPVAERLAQAGQQAIAPWLRGYAASNRSAPYTFSQLASDCLDIADAFGLTAFDVAGFGIGGALAWVLAAFHPERVRSVTSIRYPHPAALAYTCANDPETRRKWLALQAQLGAGDPQGQAVQMLAHHEAGLRRLLEAAGLPASVLERYVVRMRERGALAAALSWNSAATLEEYSWVPTVQVPSLLIWSEGPGISRAAAQATRDWVAGWFMDVAIPQGGHFLLENSPELVEKPLLAWLAALEDPQRLKA